MNLKKKKWPLKKFERLPFQLRLRLVEIWVFVLFDTEWLFLFYFALKGEVLIVEPGYSASHVGFASSVLQGSGQKCVSYATEDMKNFIL